MNSEAASARREQEGGFTLIELMVVVAIAGILGTMLAMFHLHHRALTRSISVDEALSREARLLLDHLRRDARASGRARTDSSGEGLLLEGARRVRYRLQRGRGMVRASEPAGSERATDREEVATTFPRVVRLSAQQDDRRRSLRVEIALEARLDLVQRRQRVVATVLLGGGR